MDFKPAIYLDYRGQKGNKSKVGHFPDIFMETIWPININHCARHLLCADFQAGMYFMVTLGTAQIFENSDFP